MSARLYIEELYKLFGKKFTDDCIDIAAKLRDAAPQHVSERSVTCELILAVALSKIKNPHMSPENIASYYNGPRFILFAKLNSTSKIDGGNNITFRTNLINIDDNFLALYGKNLRIEVYE